MELKSAARTVGTWEGDTGLEQEMAALEGPGYEQGMDGEDKKHTALTELVGLGLVDKLE